MQDDHIIFQIGNLKTLPIYFATATLKETLKPFSKAQARIEYVEPDYEPPKYRLQPEVIGKIAADPREAIKAVKAWPAHLSKISYFVQFKDDPSRNLIRAFNDHTELLSVICDARLQIDPVELWKSFDGLYAFEIVHSEYRADVNREEKWQDYASQLKRIHDDWSPHNQAAHRLTQRMVKQIELKATNWSTLPPLAPATVSPPESSELLLFYSYSHKDEELRDQLDNHLSILRRQGVIAGWHDRKITAGREWEGQIDENLNAAHVILLLISSDFLASDYCYDVEAKRALERHHAGEARLIPVIVRACDWADSPFGKLQALPKNAEPVKSWPDTDEAFTNVAKGIKSAIHEMRLPSK